MASTQTYFIDHTPAQQELGHRVTKLSNKIDFSEFNVGSGDTVQCLKVAKDMLVTNVRVIVVTPEGATATATVGDATAADGWDASTNLNATAGTVTAGLAGTDSYATAGKLYTAADTIDLVVSAALDTAVLIVEAEAVYLERYS
jgi:hypothetical protein